jgi:CheY-like chemotaxis protein
MVLDDWICIHLSTLLVDRQAHTSAVRENLKMLLKLEGFCVYTASNGEERLHTLRTMPRPCLLLLKFVRQHFNLGNVTPRNYKKDEKN